MPRAPRKCPRPGCDARITNRRYCPEHTEYHWVKGASRTGTREHRLWQAAVLKRDRYQCQINGPKCIRHATIADHIRNVAEGGKTLMSNGQAACKSCSDEKTQAEATRGLRRAFGLTPPPSEQPAPF
jgi:5-methylcytosine-specific restriction protein A